MRILRDTQVADKCGWRGRSTVWYKAKTLPDFPKPIKVGGITGWIEAEVDDFLRRQVAAHRGEAAK